MDYRDHPAERPAATVARGPDRVELLRAYATAARRTEQDVREWRDLETGGRIMAAVALVPERCRIDDLLPDPDRLDLTLQVQYAVLVGDFTASWYEVRDALLFPDGRIEVEWRPDEVPHVPYGAYLPGLLDDATVADPAHPYWAYTERGVDDAGRPVLEPSGTPLPPEEDADYAAWQAKVARALADG